MFIIFPYFYPNKHLIDCGTSLLFYKQKKMYDRINESNYKSNIHDKIPILICTRCMKHISLITPIQIDQSIYIETQCNKCRSIDTIKAEHYIALIKEKSYSYHTCTIKKQHFYEKADYYCVRCQGWLCQLCIENHNNFLPLSNDLMIQRELNMTCSLHQSIRFNFFCIECQVSFCYKCLVFHYDHKRIVFDYILQEYYKTKKESFQLLKDILDNNTKNKDSLLKAIVKNGDELQDLKEDINKAYQKNKEKNKIIKELFDIIQANYELFQEMPTYELLETMIMKFVVNKEAQFKKDLNLTVKENCIRFISHLNNECLVKTKRKEPIKVTTIKIESKIQSMISLNNDQFATGDFNSLIQIWNKNLFSCIQVLIGHTDVVTCLLQIKSEELISGSKDHMIKIWDLSSFSCLSTIESHKGLIKTLIQLKDLRLASGSYDNTICIWDLFNMQKDAVLKLTKDNNNTSSITDSDKDEEPSNARRKTYTKIVNGFIKIYDRKIKDISGLKNNTIHCFIQLTNENIASGSVNSSIIIWEKTTFKRIGKGVPSFQSKLLTLVQLVDDTILAGYSNNQILRWNNQMKQINLFNFTNNISLSIKRLLLFQLNDLTIFSSNGKEFLVWNLYDKNVYATLKYDVLQTKAFHAFDLKDGKILLATDNEELQIWKFS